MKHIFISYARKDQERIAGFIEDLRSSGIGIWQDVSGIPYSARWLEAIEEAIFTACGAIIVKTEAWEQSMPCAKEYQMIRDTKLPFIYLDIEGISQNGGNVPDAVVQWCGQQISAKDNGYRTWMLAGALCLYRGYPVKRYFPFTWRFHMIRNYRWVKKCERIAKTANFNGSWVESLYHFLSRVKRRILLRIIGASCAVLCLAILFVIGPSALQAALSLQDEQSVMTEESALVSMTQREGVSDPVLAMWEIERYGVSAEETYKNNSNGSLEDSFRYYYSVPNGILAELVSRNYPVTFYESVSECPVDIRNMGINKKNKRFAVERSENTAQVFIYDQKCGTVNQLLLAAVPDQYCFSKDGRCLLISAENKVYIYDLYGNADPVMLSYNFEKVGTLCLYDGQIYIITEGGHVLVWDNPLYERENTDRTIASGELVRQKDGVMAAYVDGNSLVINKDKEEKMIPLPFQGVIDRENIDISPDGIRAAIAYTPDSGGYDRIGVINMSNGNLERVYNTECDVAGFVFSEDGRSIVAACRDRSSVERIDLSDGTIQMSEGKTLSEPNILIEYDKKFLVCDSGGMLTVFDSDLNKLGDHRVVGLDLPLKQLAVSEKHDCLVTAGRGGNLTGCNFLTRISSREQTLFTHPEGETMISPVSVAVTADGEYAAFGNPNGAIYIYDLSAVCQVWDVKGITEPVIDMLFSKDAACLYALGRSGTVYSVDMKGVFDKITPQNSKGIWKMLTERSKEIQQKMQDLRLCQNIVYN